MSPAKTIPYGRRLFPVILDEMAETDPDREMYLLPPPSDKPTDAWIKITYGQVATAVDRVAIKLDKIGFRQRNKQEKQQQQQQITHQSSTGTGNNTNTSTNPFSESDATYPTVAYIGPGDPRYVIFTLACVKAGLKALLISPRNSREGQLNLFDKTDCMAVFYDAQYRDVVDLLVRDRPAMDAIQVHSTEEWIEGWGNERGSRPERFLYAKSFDDACYDPFAVLHTSGSTGLPKPVVVRAGMLSNIDIVRFGPEFMGQLPTLAAIAASRRCLIFMPMFHAAGLYVSLFRTLYFAGPIALGMASGRPATPQAVIEALATCDADTIILPPAIVEEMAYIPEAVAALQRLDRVFFGGGSLNPYAGNVLSLKHGVHISSIIGYTESGILEFYLQTDPALWEWFIVDSESMGNVWRSTEYTSDDGEVYEHFIARLDKSNRADPGLQTIFYTFPHLDEYPTRDLYIKHPTLPNHWKYAGRSDDIIVYSSGEKLNPVSMEATISAHPDVRGALVVGAGRFQSALIIEPAPGRAPVSDDEAARFVDRIWPVVEDANSVCVAHGRIARGFVMVLRVDQPPFPRAGKGTIQRAGAMKLYAANIDALYERAERDDDAADASHAVAMDVSSVDALATSLRDLFANLAGIGEKGAALGLDADFFTAAGIDSLVVLSAVRALRRGLEAAGCPRASSAVLAPRFVYAHPTANKLAAYLMGAVVNATAKDADADDAVDHDIEVMKIQIETFTRNLPTDPSAQLRKPAALRTDMTVILTGSTGALGSYILDILHASPAVRRIVCLNRGADSSARQARANAERGLATALPKAEFHDADLSRADLGLGPALYADLVASTDRIIHNAWPVNFNVSVETLTPHVASARSLADLALAAPRRVPVVFVSSIGAADRWAPADGRPVPEAPLDDLSLSSTGYGRSKLAASLVLDAAREHAGLRCAVLRVGQIAGPRAAAGAWNRHEWLPSLVASSLALRALPGDLGPMQIVDWTPAEDMAALVLEVAGVLPARGPVKDDDDARTGYFHGVNPRTADWGADLAPHVKEFYAGRIDAVVPLAEWVGLLERSAADGAIPIEKNPGVKLLDFYRSLAGGAGAGARFDMTRTCELSPTMAALEPITPELMKNWCRQWGF